MNIFKYFSIGVLFVLLPHLVRCQCSTTISTFPYIEDFETGPNGWISGGTADDWAHGVPAKPVIASAGSGSNCWVTGGLTGSHYNASERSYVKSPCFDFTSITNPFVTAQVYWETERQYDGANLQYSIDGGITWANAGSSADPSDCRNKNWFNNNSITNLASLASVNDGWSGNTQVTVGSCLGGQGSNGWKQIRHTMPYLSGEPQVMFRFTFGSGTTCNDYDGFAFDQFSLMEAPPSPSLNYLATPAGCSQEDGSVSIIINGGSGPFTFNWNPNVSDSLLGVNLNPGTYVVTVTDANGCTVTVQAHVTAAPPVMLQAQSLPDTCSESKGTVTTLLTNITPPVQYSWSDGSTSQDLVNIPAGTYTLTVTDSLGCTADTSVTIDNTGGFTLDIGEDFVICGSSGKTIQAGSFSSYSWQDSSHASYFDVTKPGIYILTVSDASGCTSTDTLEVTENCLNDIVVPNAFTPNGDGYNDLFLVSGSSLASFYLEIRNRWGQLVFRTSDPHDPWDGKTGGVRTPQGLYAWQANFELESGVQKTRRGTLLLIR